MVHPATKKRGADPEVPRKSTQKNPDDVMERKLEQGLEESMAGSDPVSITQPPRTPVDKKETDNERAGDEKAG
jgi:hypothetical protein